MRPVLTVRSKHATQIQRPTKMNETSTNEITVLRFVCRMNSSRISSKRETYLRDEKMRERHKIARQASASQHTRHI
jgi:hypothetical protein